MEYDELEVDFRFGRAQQLRCFWFQLRHEDDAGCPLASLPILAEHVIDLARVASSPNAVAHCAVSTGSGDSKEQYELRLCDRPLCMANRH